MTTALTVYGGSTASTTISTSYKLLGTVSGNSNTSNLISAPNDSTQKYSQLYPTGTMIDSVGIPAPVDKGWIYDSTVLEGKTIPAGNWSASTTIFLFSGSNITVTAIARAYKRSSGGAFTSIGTITVTGNALTTTPLAITFPSTSFSAVSFSTGDKLYTDIVLLPTTGTWSGQNMECNMPNSSTVGVTSGFNFVTPGYNTTIFTKILQSRFLLKTQINNTFNSRFLMKTTNTKTLANRFPLKTKVNKTFASRILLTTKQTKILGMRFLENTQKTLNVTARFIERVKQTNSLQSRFLLKTKSTITTAIRLLEKVKKTNTVAARFLESVTQTQNIVVRFLEKTIDSETLTARFIYANFGKKISAFRTRISVKSPLTLYGVDVAGSTMGSGGTFATQTGGTNFIASTTAPNDQSQKYLALKAGGGLGTTYSSIPTGTTNGFLFDTAVLEGSAFNTGAWNVTVNLGGSNSITCNIICQISRYNAGTTKVIGTITNNNVTIISFVQNNFTFPLTSLMGNPYGYSTDSGLVFYTGDKLLVDIFIQPVGVYKWIGNSISLLVSSTPNMGVVNGVSLVTPGYSSFNTFTYYIGQRFKLVPIVTTKLGIRLRERVTYQHPLVTRIILRSKITGNIVARFLQRVTTTPATKIRFVYTNVIASKVMLGIRLLQRNTKTYGVASRFLQRTIAYQVQYTRFIMKKYAGRMPIRFLIPAFRQISIPFRLLTKEVIIFNTQFRLLERATNTGRTVFRFPENVLKNTTLGIRLRNISLDIESLGVRFLQTNTTTIALAIRFIEIIPFVTKTLGIRLRNATKITKNIATRFYEKVTATTNLAIRLLESTLKSTIIGTRFLERATSTSNVVTRFYESVLKNNTLAVRLLQRNISNKTITSRFLERVKNTQSISVRLLESTKKTISSPIRTLLSMLKSKSLPARFLLYKYAQTFKIRVELRAIPVQFTRFHANLKVKKTITQVIRFIESMGNKRTLGLRLLERTKQTKNVVSRFIERVKTTASMPVRLLETTLKKSTFGLRLLEKVKITKNIGIRLLERVTNKVSTPIRFLERTAINKIVGMRLLERNKQTKNVVTRFLERVTNTTKLGVRLREPVANTKIFGMRLLERTSKTKSVAIRLPEAVKLTKTKVFRFLEKVTNTKTLNWRLLERTKVTDLLTTRFLEKTLKNNVAKIRFIYDRLGSKLLGWRFLERVKITFTQQIRLEFRKIINYTNARLRMRNPTNSIFTFLSSIRPGQLVAFGSRFHLENIIGVRFPSGGFGCFTNGLDAAKFDSIRATTYPDRSLSLAPITPILGATWFNYTANVPTNTSIKMEISFDGVYWYDMTNSNGAPFPHFLQQPTPTIDGFGTRDVTTNYTQAFGYNGALGIWQEDFTNSQLQIYGGVHAVLLRNGISSKNIDMIGDFSHCDNGGLVWRYVDQNDFYFLELHDDQSTTNSIGAYLYKCVLGVYTLIQKINATYVVGQVPYSYTVNFIRGAYYRFRVNMVGSLITVYMDGNIIYQGNDSSITSAGSAGLICTVARTTVHQLWITPIGDSVTGTPSGDIVTGQFVYTRQTLNTSDPTVSPVIYDITALATTPDIQMGATIPSANYTYSFLNNNFDSLTKESNFQWYFRPDQTFVFSALTTTPAPWILQSNNIGLPSDIDTTSVGGGSSGSSGGSTSTAGGTAGSGGDLELDVQNDLYRNRQTILGAQNSVLQPRFSAFGDGKAATFTLGYPVATTPFVIVNNVFQSVGTKGSTGFQWYYAVGDPVIVQDSSQTVLQTTDEFQCDFYGLEDVIVTADNVIEQQKRALIEGGSGIVEAVEDHTGEGMLLAQAQNLAAQLINRYANAGRVLIFDTSRSGLKVGQTLPIYFPEAGIMDGNFIVVEIETKLAKGIGDTQVWWFKVTTSELPKMQSWARLLSSGLGLSG